MERQQIFYIHTVKCHVSLPEVSGPLETEDEEPRQGTRRALVWMQYSNSLSHSVLSHYYIVSVVSRPET